MGRAAMRRWWDRNLARLTKQRASERKWFSISENPYKSTVAGATKFCPNNMFLSEPNEGGPERRRAVQ